MFIYVFKKGLWELKLLLFLYRIRKSLCFNKRVKWWDFVVYLLSFLNII